LKLYNYFRSSASYRVRIALNLKELNYDYHAVHLVNNGGEQYAPTYAQINPMKQVPTLVDKDFSLSQSLVIMEYLDEVHPQTKLFPHSLKDRMRVKEFCEIVNSGIQPLQNLKVTQMLEKMFSATPTQREAWVHDWLHHGFTAMESFMQQHARTFTYGNTISAGDCFLVPQVFSAHRFNFKTDKFSNVMRVYNYLNNHPLVQKAHPSKQPDYQA
jgi:maleylpyruvate isomerase